MLDDPNINMWDKLEYVICDFCKVDIIYEVIIKSDSIWWDGGFKANRISKVKKKKSRGNKTNERKCKEWRNKKLCRACIYRDMIGKLDRIRKFGTDRERN